MGALKLTYYEPKEAPEVIANFFGNTLEKNAPEHFFCLKAYTYGFNGHERDDEVKGSGNSPAFGGYGYDTRLGRRWNVDPMARLMPEWSSYSFAKDNPILYLDADGQFPFTFFVRSYESSGVFGIPLTSLGDNRVATTASGASARIHFKMDIETDGNKLMKYDAFSSPTVQLHYPIAPFLNPQVDRSTPEFSANGDGQGGYSFNASAAEPIMSKLPIVGILTPDIDIKGGISATVKDNVLSIQGQIRGDGFPDAETFVKDNSGQSLMLGTYNHGDLGSPIWSLPGDGNQEMINLNIQVELDDNGNFDNAWSVDGDGNKTQLEIIAPEKK